MQPPRSLFLALALSIAWTLACAGPVRREAGDGHVASLQKRVENSKNAAGDSLAAAVDTTTLAATSGPASPPSSPVATSFSVSSNPTSAAISTATTPSLSTNSSEPPVSTSPADSTSPSPSSPDSSARSSSSGPAVPARASSSPTTSWFNPSFKLFPVVIAVIGVLAIILILLLIGLAKRVAHMPRYADIKDYPDGQPGRGPAISTYSTSSTATLIEKVADEENWKRDEESFTSNVPRGARGVPTRNSAFGSIRAVVDEDEVDRPQLPRLPGQTFVPLSSIHSGQRTKPLRGYVSKDEFGTRDGAVPTSQARPQRQSMYAQNGASYGTREPSFPSSRIPYVPPISSATRPQPRPIARGTTPRNLKPLPPLRPALKQGTSGMKSLRLSSGEDAPRFPSGLGARAYAGRKPVSR